MLHCFFPLYYFNLLAGGNSEFKSPLNLVLPKTGLSLHKVTV